ncbi:MAG TPA: helix-turn-helix domain-containing protein [Anaerolineae bacterium]|nr:helix-turn-helix domain-containing protein [Anaerolineae bacterium]
MARLIVGGKEIRKFRVVRLLQAHPLGLTEVEIASLLGWERRTANNYLRVLQSCHLVYKEGRLWYTEQ